MSLQLLLDSNVILLPEVLPAKGPVMARRQLSPLPHAWLSLIHQRAAQSLMWYAMLLALALVLCSSKKVGPLILLSGRKKTGAC